ncbi:MAG: transglutaminase family protein [Myxococcales bacterium]|nr:transglutaminase family protein [Myxococcales bacterium]
MSVTSHADAAFLLPTETVDASHPAVADFARQHAAGRESAREAAVALYYAVRDGIRYDPYSARPDVASLRASATLAAGRGWCVAKAVLLAASCRAIGVPARLGFADVRNHLSTARLRATMGTDVFYWHGYTSLRIEGCWVKATPAFNVELCEKFGLHPLDFDGVEDSIYHPFDLEGRQHMEYVRERGEFADVPYDAMLETFRAHYGTLATGSALTASDFEREVDEEITRTPR